MTARLMTTHRVEKPWGRHHLGLGFADPKPDGAPIGEIWFQSADGGQEALLVKYLFTSERLSVQVHPNDDEAHAAGYPRGKDEAWIILDAEPDSTIALGTLEPLSHDALRRAAGDGSIVSLLDWKPVKAGDFFYSPAGTIHAIGAGITMIEVQQNVDLTYRLYDYGRPRQLHLDEGVAASRPGRFVANAAPGEIGSGRTLLADGPKFVLEQWDARSRTINLPDGMQGWLIPSGGCGMVDGVAWTQGECLMLEGSSRLECSDDALLYFAYPGSTRVA